MEKTARSGSKPRDGFVEQCAGRGLSVMNILFGILVLLGNIEVWKEWRREVGSVFSLKGGGPTAGRTLAGSGSRLGLRRLCRALRY